MRVPLLTASRLAAVFAAFAAATPAHAVFGGERVFAGDPIRNAVVAVNVRRAADEPAGTCSGFVLTKDIIVTAAHCVTIGESGGKPSSTPETVKLSWIEPVYAWTGTPAVVTRMAISEVADVALLQTAQPHPEGYVVAERDFRDARAIAEAGNAIFVEAGYGRSADGASLLLHKLEWRSEKVTYYAKGQRHVVLERKDPVGTCAGDSGGPTWIRAEAGELYLVGVHSAGRRGSQDYSITASDGRCSRISIFSPLGEWRSWLRYIVRSWSAPLSG